jgi:anti-sigma-K factor RskA
VRRLGPILALAAAVGAAVFLIAGRSTGDTVVAQTQLSNEGLASFDVTPEGDATLVRRGGRLFVELDVESAPPAGGGYLEIWLIDRAVNGMVSLGPYHGTGRYEVPSGVDPTRFPVVDVSVEPTDGVPTHSGVSVVRGVLPV